MSTFVQIYYHIVFSTKGREPVLLRERREDLYRYVWGILKNKKCHLYRINGMNDHLHILTSLHPTVSLAKLIQEIKTSSSDWIKREGVFPSFRHWQDGYGAFTKSHKNRDDTIEYIKNQERHHITMSFIDEMRVQLSEEGVEFDERYLG